MQLPGLNNFYLVGGTALALYYGHRLSEDIIPVLEKNLAGFRYRSASNPIGLFCMIGDLKADFENTIFIH